MNRDLPLEQVLATARHVAQATLAEHADRVDAEAEWPEAGLSALQRSGLGGLVVPTRHGGLGHGLGALVRIGEELGQVCASTAMCFSMHQVGAAVIAAKATADQVEHYLEPICAGEHLTTLALSEPGSGVHFYLPRTRLTRNDGNIVLDGAKAFVTNGSRADSYVVSVAEENGGAGEFSCVLVPDQADGLTWGDPWRGLGMRGNESRTLGLEGVALPHGALLGEPGDQIWYVFRVVAPYFLAAMSGCYLGIAGRAVRETRRHLRQREYDHDGSQLAEITVVQHRLGQLWARFERARRFCYWAADEYDIGNEDVLPAVLSMKAEVGDTATAVVNDALTLVGGLGYRDDHVFHRLLRDVRAAHVMSPTTDLLRTWTGRTLLDIPILGP